MKAPTILVAEDDEKLRYEIGRFLRTQGYHVLCTEDGYQALEYAIREQPDLLILDVHMPAGDGFSVQDRLQKNPELAVTPIIYMTKTPSLDVVLDHHVREAVALLRKPFLMQELLEHVRVAAPIDGAEAA